MNKTVKGLLEIDGLLLATKIIVSLLPKAILGLSVPGYFTSSIVLGLLANTYYSFKKENKNEIDENNLFKLED